MSAVSLLGLGTMGRALAHALLEAGHEVTVWNRTTARGRELEVCGAHLARNVHEAVAASPVVVTCLLDLPATAAVLAAAGPDAVDGTTVVVLSGGRPDEVARLRDWVEDRGGTLLAGIVKAYPSSIGSDETEVQVAGPRSAFDGCVATLWALGRPVHAGPDAAAAAHIFQAQSAFFETALCAFIEALSYAVAAGAPREQLFSLLPETLQLVGRAIDHVVTDLRREPGGLVPATEAAIATYASALASTVQEMRSAGASHALAKSALGYLSAACDAGLGGHEIAALLQVLPGEPAAERR